MYAPMLTPLAGIIIGILAGSFGAGYITCAITALTAITIYAITSHGSKDPVKGFKLSPLHYVWILLMFTTAGIVCYNMSRPYTIDDIKAYSAAKGRIDEVSNSVRGDKLIVEIFELYSKNNTVTKPENLKIIVQTDATDQYIDDIITMPLNLEKIEDSDNYFKRGYADYMAKKGLYYFTDVRSTEIVNVGNQKTLKGISANLRNDIEIIIERSPLNRATINFLITILLGDRAFLDPEIKNIFSDAGISHTLALSGMHVAIIAGILMWLLFPFNLFGYYKQRILAATLLLYVYAFVTGWSPSTVRATIMMTSMMLCLFLERKNTAWNSLLLATFCILIVSPSALWDVGLQLSFLCVASLIFFVRPLNPIDQHEHPMLYKTASAILTTLAATIATWSITAQYFGMLPIVFLPANLLILPFIPIYLTIAIIFITFHAIGINIPILAVMLDKGLETIESVVAFLSENGNSAIHYTPHAITSVLWIAFAICIAMLLHSNRKRLWKWTSTGVLALFAISIALKGNASENGYIIQRNPHELSILTTFDGNEKLIKMKRGRVGELNIGSDKILVIDGRLDKRFISAKKKYKIALICGGYKGDINSLYKTIDAQYIVTHPSLRRKKEKLLLDQADSLAMSVHSIRNDGPLKSEF